MVRRRGHLIGFIGRHGIAGFSAILCTVTGLAACGGTTDSAAQVPVAVAQPAAPPGAGIYERSCARCHGANLEGLKDAPALDAVRLATLGDQRLRMTIQYGKGRMRGYPGFSAQEVDDLVAYLQSP